MTEIEITKQYKLNESLIDACINGQLDKVINLIQEGADIHAKNDAALKNSCYKGHLPIVKYLIEQGADIYSDKNNAVTVSFFNKQYHVFEYLTSNHIDLHQYQDTIKTCVNLSIFNLEGFKILVVNLNIDVEKYFDNPMTDTMSINVEKWYNHYKELKALKQNLHDNLSLNKSNNVKKIKV